MIYAVESDTVKAMDGYFIFRGYIANDRSPLCITDQSPPTYDLVGYSDIDIYPNTLCLTFRF